MSVNYDPAWKDLFDLRAQLVDLRIDRSASVAERIAPDRAIKLVSKYNPAAFAHKHHEQFELVFSEGYLSTADAEHRIAGRNAKRPSTQFALCGLCGNAQRLSGETRAVVKQS